jgi:hypothetical protein
MYLNGLTQLRAYVEKRNIYHEKTFIFFTILLSACAGPDIVFDKSKALKVNINKANEHRGFIPELGKVSKATVGNTMVQKLNYDSYDGAVYTLNGDEKRLISGESSGDTWYYEENNTYCYRDDNNDGILDKVGYTEKFLNSLPSRVITAIKPLPYRVVKDVKVVDRQAISFRQELIYQGLQNNVVRISYREFDSLLARPAFQQDLTYTISDGSKTDIRFREVSMTIISADNNMIEYIVNSMFD